MADSMGSFTLPILESVLTSKHKKKALCIRRIDFLLAAKKGDEIGYYVQRLHEMIEKAAEVGVELKVHIAVTQGPPVPMLVNQDVRGNDPEGMTKTAAADDAAAVALSSSSDIVPHHRKPETGAVDVEKLAGAEGRPGSSASSDSHVHHSSTRPDIEVFIREPVEAAGGETSVVVCGGKSLVARTRNCVTRLSDDRAVHKGTGAQGIHLHVEEYCF